MTYISNLNILHLELCYTNHSRTHARTHSRTHARTHVRTHTHTHTHTHTQTQTQTHTHTHTHTHTQQSLSHTCYKLQKQNKVAILSSLSNGCISYKYMFICILVQVFADFSCCHVRQWIFLLRRVNSRMGNSC